MKDYSLTTNQEKAFKSLDKALKRCLKEGILLWDNYGTIGGINGHIIRQVSPDSSLDEELEESMVSWVFGVNINSNADDQLFVEYN